MAKKDKEVVNEETGEMEEAFDEQAAHMTALATREDGVMSADAMDDLVASGFQVVKTLKAGNPNTGCVAAYCGEVLAKGAPVQAKLIIQGREVKSDIETFAVHPAIPSRDASGKMTIRVNRKVTVRLICPNQLAGDLDSLLTKANHLHKSGLFAFRWNGKKDIKGGSQQLNDFDFIELLNDEEKKVGEQVA